MIISSLLWSISVSAIIMKMTNPRLMDGSLNQRRHKLLLIHKFSRCHSGNFAVCVWLLVKHKVLFKFWIYYKSTRTRTKGGPFIITKNLLLSLLHNESLYVMLHFVIMKVFGACRTHHGTKTLSGEWILT